MGRSVDHRAARFREAARDCLRLASADALAPVVERESSWSLPRPVSLRPAAHPVAVDELLVELLVAGAPAVVPGSVAERPEERASGQAQPSSALEETVLAVWLPPAKLVLEPPVSQPQEPQEESQAQTGAVSVPVPAGVPLGLGLPGPRARPVLALRALAKQSEERAASPRALLVLARAVSARFPVPQSLEARGEPFPPLPR